MWTKDWKAQLINKGYRSKLWLVMLLTVFFLNGCSSDIDKLKGALEAAIEQITNTTNTTSAVLLKLSRDLPKSTSSILRNEVDGVVTRGIASVGLEIKCNADYFRDIILQDLQRLLSQIPFTGDGSIPNMKANVCLVSNSQILLDDKASITKLDFYGYLLSPDTVQLLIIDADENERTVANEYIFYPVADLHMQVSLWSANGVKLNENDRKIVLMSGDTLLSSIEVTEREKWWPKTIQGNIFGAGSGGSFETTKLLGCAQLTSVSAWQKPNLIHGIQLGFDGVPQDRWGKFFSQAQKVTWTFDPGEYITGIDIHITPPGKRHNNRLQGFQLHTNLRTLSHVGGVSTMTNNFFIHKVRAPSGFEIAGFSGRHGSFIDAIGAVFRERNVERKVCARS